MRILQQLGALHTHTTDTFLFISHTTNVLLFKVRCNIFIGVRIIKEMPGSVASGTPCIYIYIIYINKQKILSTPSFGGEVKPSAPCRRFAACKRSLNLRGSLNLGKNYRTSFSPTVPPFAARISRVVADVQAPGGESGNV